MVQSVVHDAHWARGLLEPHVALCFPFKGCGDTPRRCSWACTVDLGCCEVGASPQRRIRWPASLAALSHSLRTSMQASFPMPAAGYLAVQVSTLCDTTEALRADLCLSAPGQTGRRAGGSHLQSPMVDSAFASRCTSYRAMCPRSWTSEQSNLGQALVPMRVQASQNCPHWLVSRQHSLSVARRRHSTAQIVHCIARRRTSVHRYLCAMRYTCKISQTWPVQVPSAATNSSFLSLTCNCHKTQL